MRQYPTISNTISSLASPSLQLFPHPLSELTFYTQHVHTITHTHTQPFYGSVEFVWENPGEPVLSQSMISNHQKGEDLVLTFGVLVIHYRSGIGMSCHKCFCIDIQSLQTSTLCHATLEASHRQPGLSCSPLKITYICFKSEVQQLRRKVKRPFCLWREVLGEAAACLPVA